MHKKRTLDIHCYWDGCCEPCNPGGTAAFGAVIYKGKQRVWECSRIFHPQKGREKETSNNVAEYLGFKAILEELIRRGWDEYPIVAYGDSRLVVKQMSGKWRIRAGLYVPHAKRCQTLMKWFPKLRLIWIPREKNTIADELSKRELKKAGVKFRLQPESKESI